MLVIDSLDARYHDINSIRVYWSLSNPQNESLNDYSLQILRSENPLGPFEHVTRPSLNTNMYIDYAVNTGNNNRNYYYILKVILDSTSDSTFIDSTSRTVVPPADLIALDVIRAERLLLKWYLKTKVWFYLARTAGRKCTNCWDTRMSRRTKHDCPICYGSGYEGGFFDPIPGYIEINPHPKVLQATGFGPMQPTQSSGWTTDFPLLKVNDYIFEVETGKRWKVTQIGYTEKSRYITKQMLALEGEMSTHIIYNIILPTTWVEPWH